MQGEPEDEAARSDKKVRRVVVLYVVLPMLSLFLVWCWIKHERSKVRDRGFQACVNAGRDTKWCEEAADRNHERCMELTFRPATRTSPGGSFDEQGYIECLDIGATAYWKVSAERAAERRRAPQPR